MTLDAELGLTPPWLVGGEMGALVRAYNWSDTPLGALANWPQSLRTAVDICLGSPEPACVLWGPRGVRVYNDAYRSLVRDRHPALLGRPALDNEPELASILDRVFADDGPIRRERVNLAGRTESRSFSPIHDERGAVGGAFERIAETIGISRPENGSERRQGEEHFRSFAENSVNVLWILDAGTMQLEYVSPAYERVWGEPRDRIMGDFGRWAELLHPEDRESALARTPRLLRGEFVASEYRIVRPDSGEVRWIRDAGFPIRDEHGRVRRAGGVAQDITLHKQAEEALRASEAFSRRLLASSDDCIKILDLDGRLESMSERGQHVLGVTDFERLVGTPWADLFRDEDRSLAIGEIAAAAAGESRRFEARSAAPNDQMQWWDSVVTPIPGSDGAPHKLLAVSRDVTERRRSEVALRASEARLAAIFSKAAIGLSEIGLDGRFIRVNDELCRLLGRSREELLGLSVAGVTHPDDLGKSLMNFSQVVQSDETMSFDKRYVRSDGAAVWANSTLNRLDDEQGRPLSVLAVTIDLTQRRETEGSLRRSRHRLKSLVEGIPQLVWRARDIGDWTWSSPQWSAYTGLSDAESQGHGWLDALHPDDRASAMVAWEEARDRGVFAAEYRIRHAPDDRYRWFQTRAAPLRDEAGEVIEWLGTSTDVDELRRLQEHQKVLLAELQHRVRNTLAVVRSIARRTGLTSDSVADYTAHFDGRLNAFARAQAAVTRDPIAGVDLEFLIAEELLAYAAHEGEQVRLQGSRVRLQAKAAESFSLAVHELATNAIKYGALSVPQGRIAVAWRIEAPETGETPHLRFEWTETGGPAPAPPPRRKGFGTELLERTLRYELGAHTALDFGPHGLRCAIQIPLTERTTVLDLDAARQDA